MNSVATVYAIREKTTGRVYVGATARRITRRFAEHRHHLRHSTHKNHNLQAVFDLHGLSALEFEVLELVFDEAQAAAREAFWIEQLNAFEGSGGMNLSLDGRTPAGTKRPAEVVERVAAANRGKKRTPEQLARASKAHAGVFPSEVTRQRMSVAHTGIRQTEAAKAKLSSKKARRWVVRDPEGNEFEVVNLAKFCKEHGLSKGRMSLLASGKAESYRGYSCRPAD